MPPTKGAGRAAIGVTLPTIRLVADRIVDDHRDPTLVLAYPFLETDADGWVYLPVYKAILREPTIDVRSGLLDSTDKPQWFGWFGQVGRLADVTLR